MLARTRSRNPLPSALLCIFIIVAVALARSKRMFVGNVQWNKALRSSGASKVRKVEQLEDRTAPALLGNQLYPSDNPWNQRITNAPVAANSASIMNNILTTYGNGRLHPDFGQN